MKKTIIVFAVFLFLAFFITPISNAQNAVGSFRSKKSGIWTTSTNWQFKTSLGWIDTTLIPDTFSVVTIQASHSLTLNSNIGCGDLHLNNTGVINCGNYQLSLSGKIRCYTGVSDTTINDATYTNATNPSAGNITCTIGRIKFIGISRSITTSGEWGANGLTTSAMVEFAIDSGNTGILNTSFKAHTILISSGIINMGTNRLAPDKGTAGQGDLTISVGATLQSAASASGTPVISRTTSSVSGRSGNFILNGKLKLTGNSPFIEFSNLQINSSGTVEYAGANQNWINCSFTGSANFSNYANVTLQGTSVVKTTNPSIAMTITGTMLIQGSASLGIGSAGSISYGPSSTLEYNGSIQQNTGNNPAEWPSVNGPINLCINNSNGIILGIPRIITGNLKLKNGLFYTNSTNLITLDTNASVTNASNLSFVNGPIKKIGKSVFVFPVGKVGVGLQQIMITPTDSLNNGFTAEYIRSSPYQLGYKVSGMLTKVSGCEYWTLVHNSGNSKIFVALYGNNNSGCSPSSGAAYFTGAGANISDLKVARFNNSNTTWENCGGTSLGTSPDIITTSDSINAYGIFTFGTTSSNPLPVTLIEFKAFSTASIVNITWTTATEHNSNCFHLEYSEDGNNFQLLGIVKSKGNSIENINYFFVDSTNLNWKPAIRYYRLKQIDEDGNYEYSKIIKSDCTPIPNINITINNPFYHFILLNTSVRNVIIIEYDLFDLKSNLITSGQYLCTKGNNKIEIETTQVPSGTYFIVLKTADTMLARRIIIKPSD